MAAVKAVLDTNVVVSAHLKEHSREAVILGLGLAGHFHLIVSEACLEEYEGVLRRPRFDLDPSKIAQSLRAIRAAAQLVHPRTPLHITRDPDDNKVLECATEAEADYVVTGNARDFPTQYQHVRIVTPREFLAVLATHLT